MKGEYKLGLEAVKRCAKKYIFNKNSTVNKNINERLYQESQVSNSNLNNDNETPRVLSQVSTGSYVGMYNSYTEPDSEPQRIREVEEEKFEKELEEELNLYKKTIQEKNCELLKNIKHSSEFWKSINSESHQNYVILYELALRLAAIPSSSAAIERYFSVCGNILKKNASSISVDLFIARCMIKANIEIIKGLEPFLY